MKARSGAGHPARGILRTAADERVIVEETLRDVARDALADQAGEVEYRVGAGIAGRALAEAARAADAELVVVSTRGAGGVSRLLGAVSQYVLHRPSRTGRQQGSVSGYGAGLAETERTVAGGACRDRGGSVTLPCRWESP